MGCMELKKHLLTLGVPREELDACDGKDALLHLWECKQGATAELEDQTATTAAAAEVSASNCMATGENERGKKEEAYRKGKEEGNTEREHMGERHKCR